jgi:hypothetical protein
MVCLIGGISAGPPAIEVETEHRADVIEEYRWLTSRRVRHIRSLAWHPTIAENGHGAKWSETPPIAQYQGKIAS